MGFLLIGNLRAANEANEHELRLARRAERRAFGAWNRLRPGVDDEATLVRFQSRWDTAQQRLALAKVRAMRPTEPREKRLAQLHLLALR